MSALEIDGLESGYGRLPVLHGVSLTVDANELVAVIGPNGAGKTSLVKAIFGLLPALKGTIRYGGAELTSTNCAARNELGMALVPQIGSTFPHLTVEDNLRVSFSTLDRKKAAQALASSYEMFPQLSERRRQSAQTLSGGERQMLAFASGVGTQPRLLVLDEPTTGLAPTIVQGLVERIVAFKAAGGAIMWVIEENPMEVLRVVDRVYVLTNGTISAELPAAQLLGDESLHHLFFGT